jgi:hypothetical protein
MISRCPTARIGAPSAPAAPLGSQTSRCLLVPPVFWNTFRRLWFSVVALAVPLRVSVLPVRRNTSWRLAAPLGGRLHRFLVARCIAFWWLAAPPGTSGVMEPFQRPLVLRCGSHYLASRFGASSAL